MNDKKRILVVDDEPDFASIVQADLEKEGYYGTDNRSMMMQWGMESFSNPEIVRNSLAHIRNSRMFSNNFIKDFKILDFTLLKWLELLTYMAIQRFGA